MISPLLANLFLHLSCRHVDGEDFPRSRSRVCDDAICHCRSEAQARVLQDALTVRLASAC